MAGWSGPRAASVICRARSNWVRAPGRSPVDDHVIPQGCDQVIPQVWPVGACYRAVVVPWSATRPGRVRGPMALRLGFQQDAVVLEAVDL